ncbi:MULTISPECIES: hypothetical protein [Erythrobacter]|nr:hypothetical protein [Erythrobacter sp. SN021]MCF8883755.1 hypothetical protein [Erythrobacter sp. SN021]
MSRQLALSATAAIFTMAAFAMASGFGHFSPASTDRLAGASPVAAFAAIP